MIDAALDSENVRSPGVRIMIFCKSDYKQLNNFLSGRSY